VSDGRGAARLLNRRGRPSAVGVEPLRALFAFRLGPGPAERVVVPQPAIVREADERQARLTERAAVREAVLGLHRRRRREARARALCGIRFSIRPQQRRAGAVVQPGMADRSRADRRSAPAQAPASRGRCLVHSVEDSPRAVTWSGRRRVRPPRSPPPPCR
jgi:hypothetical protein